MPPRLLKKVMHSSDFYSDVAFMELSPTIEDRLDAHFAALMAWVGTLFQSALSGGKDEHGNPLPTPEPMKPEDFMPHWGETAVEQPAAAETKQPEEEIPDVEYEGEWLSESQYIALNGIDDLPDVPDWW